MHNIEDIASIFGCAVNTMRRALNKLNVPYIKIGKKRYYDWSDLQELYDRSRMEQPKWIHSGSQNE